MRSVNAAPVNAAPVNAAPVKAPAHGSMLFAELWRSWVCLSATPAFARSVGKKYVMSYRYRHTMISIAVEEEQLGALTPLPAS